MKRLSALAAALCWVVMLCAVLSVARSGAPTGGAYNAVVLAAVAAVAAGVTLGLALAPLPSLLAYLVIHLIGADVVVAVVEGPRPPWAWRPLPAIGDLTSRGLLHINGTALALLSVALTWELAYACTWLVVRERRVWLALGVIVGTLALLNQLNGRADYMAALAVAGLALVLVTAAMERRRVTPRRLHRRLLLRLMPLLLAPVIVGLVAVAWAAPLPAPTTSAALRGLNWSGALDSLFTHIGINSGVVTDTAGGLSDFGRGLRVGGRFDPAATPVLEGRVADVARSPYWRGAVYDLYQGGEWRQLPARLADEGAGNSLPLPGGAAIAGVMTATITMLAPSNTLFSAGAPVSMTVPSAATLDRDGLPAGVLMLQAGRGAVTGAYTATSLAESSSTASVTLPAELRALDARTPPLPARVRGLALRLTSGISDPYAKAWAIQRYLRGTGSHFVYDTAPPQAPAGEDPTDYFLFVSHRGFCTHFATAMALLARLAGIPARLVTGYAAGHLTAGGVFLVTAADAHAWPELWIAGRGWLTFEPTPNFPTPGQAGGVVPAVVAPGRAGATVVATSRAASASTTAPRRATSVATAGSRATTVRGRQHGLGWPRGLALPNPRPYLTRTALLIAALVLLALLLVTAIVRARPDAVALYGRMCRLAGLLRAGPGRGQTPLEWAAAVAARSPDDGAAVQMLAAQYARQRYGGLAPTSAELKAARASWRGLRRRWLARLLARRPL